MDLHKWNMDSISFSLFNSAPNMTDVYSAQTLMNFVSLLKTVLLVVWLKTSMKRLGFFLRFFLELVEMEKGLFF